MQDLFSFEYKTFKNNLDIYPVEIVYYTKYVSLKCYKINDSDVKPIIYTGCGTNDFFINYNKRYADEMNKLNFDYEFEMWDGAHDWCFFDEAIRRSIERVYK